MEHIACPYCNNKAQSLFRAHISLLRIFMRDQCQQCWSPIEFDWNNYIFCMGVFGISLVFIGLFIEPLFDLLRNSDPQPLVVEVPDFDLIGILNGLAGATIVLMFYYASFELPAKYFGIRLYRKAYANESRKKLR